MKNKHPKSLLKKCNLATESSDQNISTEVATTELTLQLTIEFATEFNHDV